MIYSIESQTVIENVPHIQQFNSWISHLSEDEIHSIKEELNARIEGSEVNTSSWIPGADWTDTVFQPIYSKACNHDEESAGKCFGIFVWVVFMDHPEYWSFGRYEKDNIPIKGMTYFKVHPKL